MEQGIADHHGLARSLFCMASRKEPQAESRARLSAPEVYQKIRAEGEEELARPNASLWWSGVGAGFAVAASVVAETALHDKLPDSGWRPFIESFGYSVGFVIVIIGRIQLFTENTITPILPLMAAPSSKLFFKTVRLWLIVFSANVVGAVLSALLAYYGYFTVSQMHSAIAVAEPLAHTGWLQMMLKGIPAGFLIASIVWMTPNSRGFEIWVIVMATYIIAVGGYTHVVVGSVEVSMLFFAGQMSLFNSIFVFLIPAFIGNVLGGSVLFSLLAYGQVRREIH
ncbi:MAG TPA: formate/nitrite transporter family protein [Salinisphaera sp.]|nr:formate/nitrite transporter family protein [Salinisphaera sp.]